MKKNWWNSLRIKIIAWSFVPAVIILSAVAWFTFYSYQKVLGDLALKQDWAIAQSKAVEANTAIANVVNTAIRPAILTIDIDFTQPLEVRAQKILDQAPGLELFDGGIYFLDPQGKVTITWPTQPELVGEDWSDTPQFRYLVNNPPGASPVTDTRAIGPNKRDVICATWSMRDTQGEFIGASYYCLAVEQSKNTSTYKTWNALDLGADVYIIDGNQRVIFSPDASQIGKDLSAEAYIQQLLQGEAMSIRFRKENQDMVISYCPVNNVVTDRMRWILIKEQSLAEILRPTLPYRQLLLVLLSLGVIAPALVTAYGVGHITGPLQKLIQASKQVTAGQFKHQIEVKTGDEIETLADQFNLMSAELGDSYSTLEKKVADRTRELAIMNAIISVASHSLDIREILADALDTTAEQMGFKAGAAFKLEPYPTAPILIACRDCAAGTAIEIINSYAVADRGTPAVFPEEVVTFRIEDFQDEKLKNQLSQLSFQLLVFVPLATKGRKLGFFILGKHEAHRLSPEELSLLSSIGKQVGVAMENARLYEQAEQGAITAERQRLARELHDAVTQTLFSANLIADVIPRIWQRNPEEGMQNLEELRQLTRGALAEMRTLLLEMRPESLERAEIKSLITQLADAFVGRVRIPLHLEISGNCKLTHEEKLVFYRVAQEALNNIAKHSGARHVELNIECQPGQMRMRIKDDGLGFEPGSVTPDHMGIAIMRERASSIGASLKIDSQVGLGTTIELDWSSTDRS
jgi:nitrate/nitrite-specific signal transduction histidine kinase